MRNIINLDAFKLDEKEICQICNKEITSILDSNNARPVSDAVEPAMRIRLYLRELNN